MPLRWCAASDGCKERDDWRAVHPKYSHTVIVHKCGGPEELQMEEYQDPVRGPGEVFVRVLATSTVSSATEPGRRTCAAKAATFKAAATPTATASTSASGGVGRALRVSILACHWCASFADSPRPNVDPKRQRIRQNASARIRSASVAISKPSLGVYSRSTVLSLRWAIK